MTKHPRRNAEGRQSIQTLRGAVIGGFARAEHTDRLVALDFHGNPLFQFGPWELMDPQGFLFTTHQVKKEIDL